MILSRISQAIRAQNWFAVAIEFVIVILGVVIGFQVNGWAERQDEDRRAAVYLDRLLSDLETNEMRFTTAYAFREQVRDLGMEALSYASGEAEAPSDWRVILAYFNASQAGGAEPVDATYREMLATGDLDLVRSVQLRGLLASYYTSTGFSEITDSLPAYRETVRGIIPIDLQTYIWENCWQSIVGRTQRLIDCDGPETTDPGRISALATTLIGHEQVNAELHFWVSNQYAALTIHQAQIDQTAEALSALRDLIGEIE
ncbi:hypothetical protein V0U79_06135 [Hyphobacterium sp. HN65]|uniref:Uncharacterized protein n=1 Tax=Hyphobacterium lacteum TaxID=3116575 RepID=A0ABU7LPU4_9PROT|nr:hypothetical protein [Hyphobacterium sp. HN65]MEE2525938.1 hypothetical protein [Hyphobacterium sp. HN65]